MTSLLAHEVQADARHAQDANGSAEKSTELQPQLMPALTLTEGRGARLVAARLRIAAMARLARPIPSDADRTRLSRSPWAMTLPTSRLRNGAQDEADLSASHDDFRDATHALHTLEHAHGNGLVGVAAMGAGCKHGGDLGGVRPRRRHSNFFFFSPPFFLFFFYKDNTPRKLTHATRRGAMACNTEGTTVSEVAVVVNSLGRAGVSREMRD
jgi:hypothetical protein